MVKKPGTSLSLILPSAYGPETRIRQPGQQPRRGPHRLQNRTDYRTGDARLANEQAPARPSYRETVRLLASAQKGAARSAPAYSRFINRRIGRLLAAWAFRAGLTPNQVTGISAMFTFGALALLAVAPQSGWIALAVTAGLVLGYAFDSADGQVARLRGGGSPAGEWLDHVVDAVKTAALPVAVLLSFYRAESVATAWLLVPLAGTIVFTAYFFSMILTEQLRRRRGATSRADTSASSLARSLLVIPTDYGVLCLSFLLLGSPTAFALVFTAITAATAAYAVLAAIKWFRELAQEPAQPAAGLAGPPRPQ